MASIYTIGHGLLTLDGLVSNLSRHKIDLVVDVRSHPKSARAPQFDREPLSAGLEAVGVRYHWMGGALGGRPPRDLCTPAGAPDYERMSREPQTVEALDKITKTAASRKIALLCSESRPEECHRTRMLEPELELRGVDVQHILPDGSVAVRPTLFA
jgi:uncharacterized protein (DUF488 family)